MNEAPFSSNFVLYRSGLRLQHTVRSSDSIGAHVALVEAALAALMAAGHTATEAGLEEGQESHDVDAYVIGKTKGGDKVLWFYADHFEYALRGGAVYEDHWQALPFAPDVSKVYEGETKPSRDYAKEKGYWRPQKARVIIRNTGKKTDAGKDKWRFVSAHLAGQSLPVATAVAPEAPVAHDSGDALCNKIIGWISSDKVQTHEDLVTASLKAFARRSQLASCWDLVQKTIRKRLVLFFNEAADDTARESLEAAVRAIGKVLPDGDAEELCREIAATKSADVPF